MTTKDKKKRKFPWIEMLTGAVFGFGVAFFGMSLLPDENQLLYSGIALCSLFLSMYLHTIIHEGGHLIAGLFSGYEFVSFRVGSIIWLKKDGRIQRKKFSIPGTAGQCLLKPPGGPDDEYPAKFYNLGGGLANLITVLIAVLVCLLVDSLMVWVLLIPFVFVGVYLAAMNLIPLKIGGVANDGMNIKMFKSDKDARKGLWLQLEVNKLLTDGLRLRDMPEEYFHLANEEDLENPLIAAIVVVRGQRLVDQRNFDEGRQLLEDIYLCKKKIMVLYRWEAGCDLLFLELIGECRKEVIEKIMTPEIQRYLRVSKTNPGKLRTLLAYHKLYTFDEKKAAEVEKNFSKAIKTYPMEGEIQGEMELVELIKERGTKDDRILLQ